MLNAVHCYIKKHANICNASHRDLLPTASSKVQLIEGGANNLPDDHSYRAALEIYELLQSLTEDDLVLALISGMLCSDCLSSLLQLSNWLNVC